MKKTTLLAAIAAIVMVSCQKDKDSIPVPPVETSTKSIHFSIAQGIDYSDARYDGLTATLNIRVARVSKKDWEVLNIWDTTVTSQSIRLYPMPHQPFTFQKTFTGIKDTEETISLSYWIAYKDRFNQQYAEGKNEHVPEGNSNFNFHVRL